MKWITHQTGAVVLSLAFQLPLEGIAAASLGAIMPDVADQRISALGATKKQRQKIFNKIHRGSSHWFGWWGLLFLVVLCYPLPLFPRQILAGLAFGGLSHVMLDMCTPQGVPLLPFSRKNRFSLNLCSTGKMGEYVFLTLIAVLGIYFYGEQALLLLKNYVITW